MNCCKEKPVIKHEDGRGLCKKHFSKYFEEKVAKTIRQFNLLGNAEHIGVALSGGKDSLTTLYILKKQFSMNPNIKISALAIDEGIAGYRDKTLEIARKFCKEHDVDLHIYSYKKEFGMPLDQILKTIDVKPCTVCGVFRRYLLNRKSKDLGFSVLATGHNLDDEAQSIVMNQFKNNMKASARLGPKTGVVNNDRFVPRIKPLYLCSEKEVATYAFVNGILDEFTECPYVRVSYRAHIRDMLNDMEAKFPGTKHGIINSFLEVLPMLKENVVNKKFSYCSRCGEPAAAELCHACKFVDELQQKSQ